MTDAPAPGGASAPAAPGGPTPSTAGPTPSHGSAKGVGTAANLGAVSATNDLLRSALASINGQSITGGIAGRDITVHYHQGGANEPPVSGAQPVRADLVEAVREAFVTPPGFADLIATAAGRRVVLLQSAPGHGARTASLALMREFGADSLFRLDPRRPMGELAREEFVKAGGYLLCDLPEEHLKNLRGYDLERITGVLTTADAWLVLLIPNVFVPADDAVAPYIVGLGTKPSIVDVVERHLMWRVGSRRAAVVLARPEVQALVRQLASRHPSCGDAAHLAWLLAESERLTGDVDMAWVTRQARAHATHDLNAWFDGLDDLALRSLAISLALLNGLSFETVTFAAARLRRDLEDPNLGMTAAGDIRLVTTLPARPDPFRDTRAARLRRLRAQITETTVPAWFGETPTQVMSFLDPDYAPAVLNRVWEEYDEVRPILIDWFRYLGGHPSEAVRVWVAAAVGMLANRAFEYVFYQIIRPWAASDLAEHRECAAVALNIPATTGGLYEQVQNIVRDWTLHEEEPRIRATAARAYGASLGHKEPARAIASLEYLADTDDNDVANAVGRSLAELMDWDVRLTVPVLAALVGWLGGRDTQRTTSAHVAFLVVARDLAHEVAPIGTDDTAIRWPTLLHLAHTEPSLMPTIAGLWHAAFNGPLHDDAKRIFTQWAITVEPDRRPCEALSALAAQVGKDERTRKILRQLAADWTTGRNPEPTPHAATSIIKTILG